MIKPADTYESIVITHLVNPHGMWCSDDTNVKANIEAILKTGEEIKQYVNIHPMMRDYDLSIGQVVAYYELNNRMWMRAVVDKIYQQSGQATYLIWLIDLGHHLELIKKKRQLIPLVPPLSDQPHKVYKIGLYGIVPACQQADILFTKCEAVKCSSWKPGAVRVIENLMRDALRIKFTKQLEKIEDGGEHHFFGKVTVMMADSSTLDMSQVLVQHHMALYDEPDFLTRFKKMKPVKRTSRILPHPLSMIGDEGCVQNGVQPPAECTVNESRVLEWAIETMHYKMEDFDIVDF